MVLKKFDSILWVIGIAADFEDLPTLCRSFISTTLSPVLQNPLGLAAELVIYSGTKFLSGHSDTSPGVKMTSHENLHRKIAFFRMLKEMHYELREHLAPPEDLVRVSIGIEDVDDLIEDLDDVVKC